MPIHRRRPGHTCGVVDEGSLAQLCHLQAFLDQYAAVPRELIHHQMPRLVPTGDIGWARRDPAAWSARRPTTSRPN
ncbi:hypothetical protein GCM10010256_14810 [Streptomyces coeruleorubidus]|nr:hypothetical protein GCM10010256_14810 [Streptomyces coeruleorubidus]